MALTEKTKPSVEYNWLSENCGLKVSNICLGTMTFGTASKGYQMQGNTNEVDSFAILDRYVELGGNFLDTANVYTNGESEEIIGSWLSSRERGSIVLATKVFASGAGVDDSMPNARGLSRGSIMQNVAQSLRRLKTDYIDIYYMHWPDELVELEETLRAFNDLVRSGKVRYVGLSNFTGSLLQKVMDYNHFMGFDACVTLQQQYSLLNHDSDVEVVPTCRREGISLIPYSPLKRGLLTGIFKRDDHNTAVTLAGTRLGWVAEKPSERSMFSTPYVETYRNDENFWKLMDTVEAIGKQHGKSQSQVSLRWLLQKDFIPSVTIGVNTVQQLEENMGAGTGWKLTDEEMKLLDDVSMFAGSVPKYPYQSIDSRNESINRTRQLQLASTACFRGSRQN